MNKSGEYSRCGNSHPYPPTQTLGEAYTVWKRMGRQRNAVIVRTPVSLHYLIANSDWAAFLVREWGWKLVKRETGQ